MVKEQAGVAFGSHEQFSVTREEQSSRSLAIRSSIEQMFRERVESNFFEAPGVPLPDTSRDVLLQVALEFIQEVTGSYSEEIRFISTEDFKALASVFAQDPSRPLPERRVWAGERLDMISARVMARMGFSSRFIGNTLHRDRNVISSWTSDVQDDVQEARRKRARQLIASGASARFVQKRLSSSAANVNAWCADLLRKRQEEKSKRIAKERELAEKGYWPVDIGRAVNVPRTRARVHIDDIWKRKWKSRKHVYEAQHKKRVAEIRKIIEDARESDQKINRNGLAKALKVSHTTITRDLERSGIELP